MNVLSKVKDVTEVFRRSGIEEPGREAEMLVTGLLEIDRATLYAGDVDMPEDRAKYIDGLAERRTRGEPLQYLTGHVLFCGLKINVGSGVLIPRPETELLVEEAIRLIRQKGTGPLTILDLCTGSGCIALALARHFPDATVYGVDASEHALEYATRNAAANNIHNAEFRRGDLWDPVNGMSFDCVVSNPPYVVRDEIETLQKEVRDHEPFAALDGGVDGLDFYKRIFREAPAYLREDGIIILEAGFGQADAIRELAQLTGFKQYDFIKDFAGIERIFTAKL
ncbi:MAG: peptide chain release factor N(5)-glutamine methyltransferase [Nitrospirae bacterium]|nr:peptide chain release factor N(5)-glutamine methyltransferase [Nitrospirota bacterium]